MYASRASASSRASRARRSISARRCASLPSASITAQRSKLIITSGSRSCSGNVVVSVQDCFDENRLSVSIAMRSRLDGTRHVPAIATWRSVLL